MELIDVPAAVMPITPRRRTVPAVVSNISDMQPLPSAPVHVPVTERTYKNAVVPLVANVSLVAEIEKLHVKVDAVSVDIARVSNIMQVVGEAEPLAPVPAVVVPAPVDNLAQILDEMRLQQRETRDSIGLWAVFVMLFIAMLYMVHVPPSVCVSSPACAPITECASVIPSKWDALTACARIMLTNEEY